MNRIIFNSIIFLFLATSSALSGQEYCNNGVDDNLNGLIDIQDPLCASCYEIILDPLVEDFEDYNCCPNSYSDAPCLNGGWKEVAGTPDYYNTCGWLGVAGTWKPPLPIPSGEGCVGFVTGEAIGSCLESSFNTWRIIWYKFFM